MILTARRAVIERDVFVTSQLNTTTVSARASMQQKQEHLLAVSEQLSLRIHVLIKSVRTTAPYSPQNCWVYGGKCEVVVALYFLNLTLSCIEHR
jgi:hypothetical protein